MERGIMDWNHATEMLKKRANSQWHIDASATAAMAQKAASGMCAGYVVFHSGSRAS